MNAKTRNAITLVFWGVKVGRLFDSQPSSKTFTQLHAPQRGFGVISPKPVSGQRPDFRQGLSRWRGGRYRVVNQESSGTADIVWVIGKGDSCDPFTQDDAGGTPASQLLCHHRAQLPAGGKRFCQAFWQ